ncbi:hypothetical protein Tco_0947969, partial [Tanacetum coccineum]
MATLIDLSKYVLNRPKIDNLTQDILLGPAYNLLKGTCSSSIELEYHFQECFNALTDRLDQNNPKGDRYPFDLSKPLPLQGYPGYLTYAVDYIFNDDLEYLKSSDPERTYTTLITKTKAAWYEIEGIEDMVPTLWSPTKVGVKKLHGYGHLEEIVVKRADRQFYKFKEGDFVDLHLNDIEDMLLLTVQQKLFHLIDNDIVDFIMAFRMFTRSLVIKKRVEDLQLGVESYQKKLNITPPQQTFPEIEFKELYTPSHKPLGIIYEDLTKQKRVMRADKVYKFSDGTLKKVRDELHHRIRDFRLEYNTEMPRRKWTAIDRKRENVDHLELIWEDHAYQIDHRKENRSRCENMPFPQFTKVIINHFLKQYNSLSNLKFQHYHTIKDDGIVCRLKFVRIGEDYQEYGLSIPETMLTEAIKQSESYQMFINYSTGQIPPKKSRGKGSQRKKTTDDSQETVDVSEESKPEPEPVKRKTSSKRRAKKKITLSADDNIIYDDPDTALELGKSISKTKAE